jgi:uncharacterized protein VirK/YbjX
MVNGFKSAFLPFREKKQLLRRVTADYDALVTSYSGKKTKAEAKVKLPPEAETSAEA